MRSFSLGSARLGSERVMGRFGLMSPGPPSQRGAVDAVGGEAGHAGVVGQGAGLLVARWAGAESAPMNRAARSSRAVVWVTVIRPVQSRNRSWGGRSSVAGGSTGPP